MNNTQIRRAELKELSASLKPLVEEGKFRSINHALKSFYAKQGHTELHTLQEWNMRGSRIRSGEKALVMWEMQKKVQKGEETQTYYPIRYVFSELQTTNYQPLN